MRVVSEDETAQHPQAGGRASRPIKGSTPTGWSEIRELGRHDLFVIRLAHRTYGCDRGAMSSYPRRPGGEGVVRAESVDEKERAEGKGTGSGAGTAQVPVSFPGENGDSDCVESPGFLTLKCSGNPGFQHSLFVF